MTAPRVNVSVTGPGADKHLIVDQQVMIPSHVVPVPGLGDVLFHHATGCNIAEISINDGAQRIAVMLAMPGCGCGCGASGRGLFLTPGAAEARIIAQQLIDIADRQERDAAQAAGDAIRKASGR